VPLDRFRAFTGPHSFDIAGNYEQNLRNLFAYFWRWATWKVFDIQGGAHPGVVCLITPASYLRSKGYQGMRRYLREVCDEGWVIDLTPEGKQPPADTAIFGIETEVAIGLFIRKGEEDL